MRRGGSVACLLQQHESLSLPPQGVCIPVEASLVIASCAEYMHMFSQEDRLHPYPLLDSQIFHEHADLLAQPVQAYHSIIALLSHAQQDSGVCAV